MFKLWIPLEPQDPSSFSILNGSTVLLKEIDSMFYKTVTVDLDKNIKVFNDVIEFYGQVGSCDQVRTELVYLQKKNFFLTEKKVDTFTPIYILKGSTFDYVISGEVKNSSQAKVCVYSGSRRNEGHQTTCLKVSLRDGYGFGQYTIEKSDYYYIKVVLSDNYVKYSLNISGDLKILQVPFDQILSCSIITTNLHCRFVLPLTAKFCLMAKFYPNPFGAAGVKLAIQVKDSRFDSILAPSLSVTLLFLLIFAISFVLLCFCMFHAKRSSSVTIV